MDTATADAIREELLRENQIFRDLVEKHQSYEKRLVELSSLTYPSDEEIFEESILKKKKLMVKDEIYSMMQNYTASH